MPQEDLVRMLIWEAKQRIQTNIGLLHLERESGLGRWDGNENFLFPFRMRPMTNDG